VPDELEAPVIEQVFDVGPRSGEEIIRANDVRAACDQTLAQMRPDKTGAARH